MARKDPTISLLASIFIPGLGTILNGETVRGFVLMACFYLAPFGGIVLMFLAAFVSSGVVIPGLLFLVMGVLVSLGVWVWGIVDAYRGAEAHNRRHGIY